MWKLILILLAGFTLQVTGQNDTLNRLGADGKKTGYWISKDQSGLKVYEGFFQEGKPVGLFLRFHANGKTRAEMNYQNNGERVETRLFDTDGRLRAEGVYLNQLREGPWSFYSEKKKPVYRINYCKGKINGEAFRYDGNGILMEQTQWINNLLSGLQTIYYPDNKPQAKINYTKGVIDGPYQLLFPDGRTEVHGVYSSGLKTGTWIYYLPDGQTDYLLRYKNGKLLNPEVLDTRQRMSFDRYDKNRSLLKDPQDFLNNPDELLK